MKLEEGIEIIKENRIDRIDLDNSQIGATGAQAFAQALAQNSSLCTLCLDAHHLFEDDRIKGYE